MKLALTIIYNYIKHNLYTSILTLKPINANIIYQYFNITYKNKERYYIKHYD